MGETELIGESLANNHAAFEELVERNKHRLYASILRLTHSEDLAEEIVHDTFVRAFLNLDKFRCEANFSTWLFRVATNLFLTTSRKRRNTMSLEQFKATSNFEPVDTIDSAERALVRREERQLVYQALDLLDSHSKAILVLREIDGLSYDELADVLCIKLGTVRSRLARARTKLHDILHVRREANLTR